MNERTVSLATNYRNIRVTAKRAKRKRIGELVIKISNSALLFTQTIKCILATGRFSRVHIFLKNDEYNSLNMKQMENFVQGLVFSGYRTLCNFDPRKSTKYSEYVRLYDIQKIPENVFLGI
ncbi:hypothetical protein DMUE_3980 [Dictyocoela muelleri]|nr:hypothetical protein DMUE_3980 [Dictyocoela muelleri]